MRTQFHHVIAKFLREREDLVVILGDIGVWAFRREMADFPQRVINYGIAEQSMVSFAAGIASRGLVPLVHTIAPFLTERALEQIKIDFGYQGLGGNLVSVGASFDYLSLGSTHHAPADVQVISSVPRADIAIPGHPDELESLFGGHLFDNRLTYYRLSEQSNSMPHNNSRSHFQTLQSGDGDVVVCLGPALGIFTDLAIDSNLSVLYVNFLSADVAESVIAYSGERRVLVLEPFYQGSSAAYFSASSSPGQITYLGVPRKFVHRYQSSERSEVVMGLSREDIEKKVIEFAAQT